MRIVEFFGVSGVGKSTFSSRLGKILPYGFSFRSQAVDALPTIAIEDLNVKENDIDFISELLSKKGDLIVKNDIYNDETKKKLVNFFYSELLIDLLINYQFIDDVIIYDDGLIHNFGSVFFDLDSKYYDKYFSNRDFVYIDADNDFIIDNLKKRHDDFPGALNDWYGFYQDKNIDLYEVIEQEREQNKKLIALAKSYGSEVLIIDSNSNFESYLSIFKDFFNRVKERASNPFITEKEFYLTCKGAGAGHWGTQPLWKRWSYHKEALSVLEKISIKDPSEVLEIGTVGLQLVKGSDTLDQDVLWDFKGKNPTYIHDARNIPWPIEKKYKVIIALRVFQYLVPYQKEAFEEARRLAEHLIIVVPRAEAYQPEGFENSHGITLLDFIRWGDKEPKIFKETDLGNFYYWDFSNN